MNLDFKQYLSEAIRTYTLEPKIGGISDFKPTWHLMYDSVVKDWECFEENTAKEMTGMYFYLLDRQIPAEFALDIVSSYFWDNGFIC